MKVVKACLEREMDKRREQRIHDVLRRHEINMGRVDWTCFDNEDSDSETSTNIEFQVCDDEKARRVSSELRSCGMVVSLASETAGVPF